MPTYIPKMLKKFNHHPTKSPQHAPHKWNTPSYVQRVQYASEHDKTTPLDKTGTTRIQQRAGSVLYQARALDPFSFVVLTEIGTKQARPWKPPKKKRPCS